MFSLGTSASLTPWVLLWVYVRDLQARSSGTAGGKQILSQLTGKEVLNSPAPLQLALLFLLGLGAFGLAHPGVN